MNKYIVASVVSTFLIGGVFVIMKDSGESHPVTSQKRIVSTAPLTEPVDTVGEAPEKKSEDLAKSESKMAEVNTQPDTHQEAASKVISHLSADSRFNTESILYINEHCITRDGGFVDVSLSQGKSHDEIMQQVTEMFIEGKKVNDKVVRYYYSSACSTSTYAEPI